MKTKNRPNKDLFFKTLKTIGHFKVQELPKKSHITRLNIQSP